MSDLAIGADAKSEGRRLLTPITAAILVGVGIACFIASLVLGAYAPDLKGGENGGGHALSSSFNGFAAVIRLAEATGRKPRVVRNQRLFTTEDLVVATPENGRINVDPVIGRRSSTPTLVVLPKWATAADKRHRGWATVEGLLPDVFAKGVLAPAAKLDVVQRRSGGRPLITVEPLLKAAAFAAPRPLQAIRRVPGNDQGLYGAFYPLIEDELGNIVLGRFENRPLYILADPDLIDNRGMHDARTAASALAMLDFLNSNEAEGIAFDVTLNGIGQGASPLKLLFEPPFLATTLTLAAAILLAALGTVARFGSPRPRERAIAFGKTALVDNTAALVAKARAEVRLGGRYADAVREVAVRAFAVPAKLRGPALDAQLDRLERGDQPFTALADGVARAQNRTELVGAAQALHGWLKGREK